MQVVLVTRDLLESVACTSNMVEELLVATLGYSAEAAKELMASQLSKPGKAYKDLPHNKARTIIIQKLSQHEFYSTDFNAGRLRVTLLCLATPEEPSATQRQPQQEKKAGAPRSSTTGSLRGAYWVKKHRNIDDAGQKEVYDALWSCRTFEEFYAKAPAKSVTRTGRVVTAVNVMGYALKMGWIVAGEKPQEQQAEQQAEQQQAA